MTDSAEPLAPKSQVSPGHSPGLLPQALSSHELTPEPVVKPSTASNQRRAVKHLTLEHPTGMADRHPYVSAPQVTLGISLREYREFIFILWVFVHRLPSGVLMQ